MYPIMEHVSRKMTSYLRTKLDSKPDGVDLKDVSVNITVT